VNTNNNTVTGKTESTSDSTKKLVSTELLKQTIAALGINTGGETLQSVTTRGNASSNTITGTNVAAFKSVGAIGNNSYYYVDQTANTGGKLWRFGNAGVSNFGTFDVYNQTDNVTGLSISAVGAISYPNAPSALTGGASFLKLNTTSGIIEKIDSVILFSKFPKPLADYYTDAGNTSTVETTLFQYGIPAATMTADGQKIKSEYGGIFAGLTTPTKQVKAYLGSTEILNTGALTMSVNGSWSIRIMVIRSSNTTARVTADITTPGASTAVYTLETDVTGINWTTTSYNLYISGTSGGVGAATNDIVAKLGTVTWLPAAP
jgi:hypothetical protein